MYHPQLNTTNPAPNLNRVTANARLSDADSVKLGKICSLQELGLFSQALNQIQELDLAASMPLVQLLNITTCACRLRDAKYYLETLPRDEADSAIPAHLITLIENGMAAFDLAKLSDDEAEALQKTVYATLHDHHVFSVKPKIQFIDPINVQYQIAIDMPIPELVELNFKIAENIAQFDNMWEDVIYFKCTSIGE